MYKIIKNLIADEVNFLQQQDAKSQVFHIFWLIGPFVLLIERSPADLWLTVCGLFFLYQTISARKFDWLSHFWVRATLCFWFICLLSALLSDLPSYSMGEAFIWIRFPLFAFACCFLFANDRRALNSMYLSMLISMLLMSIILLTEYLLTGGQNGRLVWPYGDKVSGNYLAKVSMPVFCVLVAHMTSSRFYLAVPSCFAVAFTTIISLLTGERLNFIMRIASAALVAVSWKPNFLRLFYALFFLLIIILIVFIFSPSLHTRFFVDFVNELPVSSDSPYYRVWLGGFEAFLSSPLIGIGPDNYRILCVEYIRFNPDIDCHTHPHNFYVQIAAETGFVGLAVATIMFCSMIMKCIRSRFENSDDVLVCTAFVVPAAFFVPLQSTADFFGQWNNLFMWTALGVAMSACYSRKVKTESNA